MIRTYTMILSLLTRSERRKFYTLLAVIFVMSIFEMGSVISILPFLQVMASPEVIQSNQVYARLYEWGGFTTAQNFTFFLGGGVFLITILGLIVKTLGIWVLTRFALMRSYSLSSRLLSGYLHQPYIWFLSRHSSDLGSGVLTEVDRMVSNSLLPAMRLIPETLMVVLLVTFLFFFEPMVAIGAVLVLGGAYLIIYFSIRNLLLRIGHDRLEANTARFHIVNEATGGVKELKLLGLEKVFLQRFRVAAFKMARTQTTSQVLSQIPRYALEAIAFGGMILLILVLLVRNDGNVPALIPTLGLIAMAGTRLFPAMQQVYSRITIIRFNQNTLERIHTDILGLPVPKIQQTKTEENTPQLQLHNLLELNNINYSYPGTKAPILQDFSIKISANTTTGIIGGTGAGKTTVVDIILGLLQQDQGELRVDGDTVTPGLMRSWQKTLGYVPQQIFLSDDSVAANIAFGVPIEDLDMAAVEQASRLACLHDFVTSELSHGYETAVGERGVRLSGGQRQRIGIARALYHDPDVLIMDEATSALDNLTERVVMDAVHSIGKSKTIILIAHRLTTVKNCDKIFLLNKGRISAEGTFSELLETNDEFKEMAAGLS